MLLNKILKILEADLIGEIKDLNKEIKIVYGSDLMSDVLAFIKPGALLLTGLINPQVVRTAEMAEIMAICFIQGKIPPTETIELAKEKGIPLLTTGFSMYEASGRLYKEGLAGSGSCL